MMKHLMNSRLKDFLLNSPSARLMEIFSGSSPFNYIIEVAFGSSNKKPFLGARPLHYNSGD